VIQHWRAALGFVHGEDALMGAPELFSSPLARRELGKVMALKSTTPPPGIQPPVARH